MDPSPITISSSGSDVIELPGSDGQNSPISVISHSDSTLEHLDSDTTISNDLKVQNWMKDHENIAEYDSMSELNFDSKSSERNVRHYPDNNMEKIVINGDRRSPPRFYDEDDNESDSIIVVQYNFDKTVSPKSLRNKNNGIGSRATSSLSCNSVPIKPLVTNGLNNNSQKIVLMKPVSFIDNSVRRLSTISDISVQPQTQNVPLSPESQKKKELCSYLQLMNPADKKEILSIQNRRSTRVKNLNLMLEKKELERKLREDQNSSNESCSKHNEEDLNNYPTLKSFSQLNMTVDKRGKSLLSYKKKKEDYCGFHFPPVPDVFKQTVDFDNCIRDFLKKDKKYKEINHALINGNKVKQKSQIPARSKHATRNKSNILNKRIVKSRKKKTSFNTIKIKLKPRIVNKRRIILNRQSKLKSLRSTGQLKNVAIKKLLLKKRKQKSKPKKVADKTNFVTCEIITVDAQPGDVDRDNFIDDLKDFDNLSSKHKKCFIESRILPANLLSESLNSNSSSNNNSNSQLSSPLLGFTKKELESVEHFRVLYKDLTSSVFSQRRKSVSTIEEIVYNSEKPLRQSESSQGESVVEPETEPTVNTIIAIDEHDYATPESDLYDEDDDDDDDETSGEYQMNSNIDFTPFCDKQSGLKSLHRSLTHLSPRKQNIISNNDITNSQTWDMHTLIDSPNSKTVKKNPQSHTIHIAKENGAVLNAFYIEYNLIICQESIVSFWMQSALGNVLGAQNMWIPRGHIQRLVLNNKCTQKESMEMVIAMENNVAYVELWTKEHKSDFREGPVADVFATLYFWKQRQNGLEKKVIQLENIKGFADDVQYIVTRYCPKIIVSWNSVNDSKITQIHAFKLADDYQTVANIYEIQSVNHYISSLHNIEDCDSLIMGCGENKITLWNIEHGYIVATIELLNVKSPLSTLWVKSDRGFLFTLQQCVDGELRLIAINGINHSWKRLASYHPPIGFDRLRGVCIENGVLVSFYDKGILCWNAQTGEPVVEEIPNETEYIPSGKYVIMITNDQIAVKHAITHLISADDS